MTKPRVRFPHRGRLSDLLTSRRGAWACLALALIAFMAVFGMLGSAQGPAGTDPAPASSESARVAELLTEFPGSDVQPVIVVVTREDGSALTSADLTALDGSVPGASGDPILSADGLAAVITAPVTTGASNTDTAKVIAELRSTIGDHTPAGLTMLVTGGPAFGADIASAFDGADFALLAVTILIVAVLLIFTYRSPVLWLIPLIVVAIADRVAGLVTAAIGSAAGLEFDAGIISVLVFGAGTNYALLLISRYREELPHYDDHRVALARAWRETSPAILASNVTVVLALATFALAVVPGTHGLGVSAAVGLAIALASVLFILPPFLAVCGRGIFWPFVPRPGEAAGTATTWRRIADTVMRRPGVSLVSGLVLLAVMTTGLLGTSVGLDQVEKFRVQSESATGLEVLSEHFPPGEAQPILIVTNSDESDAVLASVDATDGVVRAHPAGVTDDGALTTIMVTGEYAPGTAESLAQIEDLRTAVHAVPGADALVGGAVATDLDARAGNRADLWLIAPLVIAVTFVVLAVLLRSLLAPVLLLAVNILSALAAIGVGAWGSRLLFDQPALDLQVPLLAFMFLVALGIDYTIFLVHRARAEARVVGTRAGMVNAVAHTGSVITSAGIVLAGVFAALGILPLVTLAQLGLIVGIGVIVDTVVVRSVIVPSIFGLVGDRIWWPSRVHHDDPIAAEGQLAYEPGQHAADIS